MIRRLTTPGRGPRVAGYNASKHVRLVRVLDHKLLLTCFAIIVDISQSLRGICPALVAFLTQINQSHAELRQSWLPARRVRRIAIRQHNEKGTGFGRR